MYHDSLAFFLGGYDLEMQTIADVLAEHVAADQIHDQRLSWGAKASDYNVELDAALHDGIRPVLIELAIDRPLSDSCILIDHHNERSGADQPTSLEQLFRLLSLPKSLWTRWHALVAANDRGYLLEMASIGASREEMIAIRKADRQSQGINADEERLAVEAVSRRTIHANGNLTLIEIPHTRTSAVTDRMEPLLGGPGYANLIVGTPSAVSFFGVGSLIELLRVRFPGGWWGGALPVQGYWGASATVDKVLAFLIDAVTQNEFSKTVPTSTTAVSPR